LSHVLVHAQKVYKRRHQHHAAANAQQADKHTHTEPKQEDDKCHRGMSAAFWFFFVAKRIASIFARLAASRNRP
jgi:ABC-type Zn2+ transport system substrate-binding protein/surface adhesin